MIIKITLILITLFCATVFSQRSDMVAPSPLSSAFIFPAGYAAYNTRSGYRKFDGIKGYEHLERENFLIYGGTAGMRFPFKKIPRLRLQTTIEAGLGNSDENIYEDALIYASGETGDLYDRLNFFTAGALMDAHALFPTDNVNRMMYLSAGVGLHVSAFDYTWETKSGQEIAKTNKMRTLAYSLNAGIGIEHRFNRQRAVAVGYNFRFWSPVSYRDFGDMFPMGVDYVEYFYSHAIQIHILLPRSAARGFR